MGQTERHSPKELVSQIPDLTDLSSTVDTMGRPSDLGEVGRGKMKLEVVMRVSGTLTGQIYTAGSTHAEVIPFGRIINASLRCVYVSTPGHITGQDRFGVCLKATQMYYVENKKGVFGVHFAMKHFKWFAVHRQYRRQLPLCLTVVRFDNL